MEKYCFTSNIWDLSDLDNPTYTIKKLLDINALFVGKQENMIMRGLIVKKQKFKQK